MLIGKTTSLEYAHGDYRISCLVTGEEWKQNTYVVTNIASSNTIVIDPGNSPERIIQLIMEKGGKSVRILLTHPHHDHVGAASQVSGYFAVPCELHKLDVRLLMHAPMYALRFANQIIPAIERFQPFEELGMRIGGPEVRSIHTPGHTKGSACYIFDGFVFTGDTLLYKRVGRTDLPGSNAADIAGSIGKILNEVADETVLFPGHGKPWTVGEAKHWWQELQGTPPVHMSFADKLD
jgi:glyoxylase-like metal-dependent hydrolase (beta-lactamase superfamily II)